MFKIKKKKKILNRPIEKENTQIVEIEIVRIVVKKQLEIKIITEENHHEKDSIKKYLKKEILISKDKFVRSNKDKDKYVKNNKDKDRYVKNSNEKNNKNNKNKESKEKNNKDNKSKKKINNKDKSN